MDKEIGYVIDDADMVSDVCYYCKHFRGAGHCVALPKFWSIPREIWIGEHDHRTPYPGDNGIMFEPRDENEPLILEPPIYD